MCKTRLILTMVIAISMTIITKAQNKNDMEQTNFTVEQKNVLNAIKNMTAAFHNKDIEGVMSSYESEALIVFEPEQPVSDPSVIRQMFQGAFTLNPKFEYDGHEVFINGDTAIHFSPWEMKGRTPDGKEVVQTGLSVAVLRKQPNGDWLMVFDNPHGQFLMNKK
ncbi:MULTISPECIES: YybH family protein [Aquimarina]|uniref:YybH family protein n=1 Tax=Aquimarina TaxID=290174 RepID=UPI00135B2CE3|nr:MULTISPECIES: DUF4440 domain-containing protein [Aquimarina]